LLVTNAIYACAIVSFMNSLTEKSEIHREETFFKENPQLGGFLHWGILGAFYNACKVEETLRKELALNIRHWDIDHLINRTHAVYEMVHSPSPFNGKPLVIYVHCMAGTDRTGEFSGSYYMRYLNWTFLQTLKFDYTVSNRPITSFSEYAMNWVCWYFYYTRGTPADCRASLPRQ